MKQRVLMILSMLIGLCVLSSASAEMLTFSGTTDAVATVTVCTSVGGMADTVPARAGQAVSAGDVLFTLRTNNVYAEVDGTVAGVFGEPGDSAETVVSRYGAVLYLEEESSFSVSASIRTAFSSAETKFIHTGETVWLRCPTDLRRTGTGIVKAVNGSGFTVRVTDGDFIVGETVNCYRDAAFSTTQRIGQGSVDRISPVAVTASGAIVRIAVRDGDHVQRGDLLLETLEGSYEGLVMTGSAVTAPADGILASLSVTQGSSVQPGMAVAEIWSTDVMGVTFFVPEDERGRVTAGSHVTVELAGDESASYSGTVTMVSAVAEDLNGETVYRATAEFTPDDRVAFGMSVFVTVGEEAQPENSGHE